MENCSPKGGRKDGQYLMAIDLKSRRERWAARVSSNQDEPPCTPTVTGDSVFALSKDGELICCEAGIGRAFTPVRAQSR